MPASAFDKWLADASSSTQRRAPPTSIVTRLVLKLSRHPQARGRARAAEQLRGNGLSVAFHALHIEPDGSR